MMAIDFVKRSKVGPSKENFTEIYKDGVYIGWFTQDEVAFGNCLMTTNEYVQIHDKIKNERLRK